MKLTDLEPRFLAVVDAKTSEYHDDVARAIGIIFLCPKCLTDNGGSPIGVHSVICWTPKVAPKRSPGPGRWNFVGTGYGDLSLVAGSSSVQLEGGCQAHFFIRSGTIEMC